MRARSWKDVNEAVRLIAGTQQTHRSTNNLQVTNRMVKLLGLEPAVNRMDFVHIAGSKGKGSTSAYCAKLLECSGLRVGLFTSPHLYDVRERFMVNYEMLPKDVFTKYFFEMYDRQKDVEVNAGSEFDRAASRSGFFRFCFYLALHAFNEEKVDVVVLETGLGGRIDSTNVVQPKVTAITSLGLEHTEILGDTIEEIATEKAGIIKQGIPCFTDPQRTYPSALQVLKDTAIKVEAPLVICDEKTVVPRGFPKLAMEGEHMVQNARIGLACSRFCLARPLTLPIQPDEKQVLETLTFEGRSQVHKIGDKCTVYLDGAHTPESMALTSKWFMDIAQRDPKRMNIFVFFTQREPAKILPHLKPLKPFLYRTVFSPVEYTRNAAEKEVLKTCVKEWEELYPDCPCSVLPHYLRTPEEYQAMAQTDIHGVLQSDVEVNVFVTGSLYLVGTVVKGLQRGFDDTTPAEEK